MPGSLGTLVTPYDFSAMRFIESPQTKLPIKLHNWFCGLSSPGHRWRNMCDAASIFQLFLVLLHNDKKEPYSMLSAFNGATMYPLKLVRDNEGTYDTGDDGQRCEHIGFHYSLNSTVVVNPKWSFHIHPDRIGGPTGARAAKAILLIMADPLISTVVLFQHMVYMSFVTYVTVKMILHYIYPAYMKIILLVSFGDKVQLSSKKSNLSEDEKYFVLPTYRNGTHAKKQQLLHRKWSSGAHCREQR